MSTGDRLLQAGALTAAAAAYEDALASDPGDAAALRGRALCLFRLGDARGALALLLCLVERGGAEVMVLRELATAALHAGALDTAAAALAQAEALLLRAGQRDVDVWLQQAAVAALSGRLDVALDRLRAALALAPERTDVLRPLGELCEVFLRDGEAAALAYGAYLRAHPDDEEVRRRQARLLSR